MIEVDFIPVGEEANTGDAILCRLTEPGTTQERVMLIDGGFADTATAIALHVQQYYATTRIDLMVCTHPDNDHINGLFGIFDHLTVAELVIHRPAEHGYTSDEVKADRVDELIDLARSHGTTVTTGAFAGSTFFSGAVLVAGPTKDFYTDMLAGDNSSASMKSLVSSILRASAAAVKNVLMPRTTDPGGGVDGWGRHDVPKQHQYHS